MFLLIQGLSQLKVSEMDGRAGAKETWNRKEAQRGAGDDQNLSKIARSKKRNSRHPRNERAGRREPKKGSPHDHEYHHACN